MQYLGGKSRIAKQICNVLEEWRTPNQLYIEPFIGGCSVFSLMKGPKEGYDIHPDLISMWQAVQQGWIPPDELSENEYQNLKRQTPSALRGFAGFACSFGGKWFGGYARQPGHNYAKGGQRSIVRKASGLANCVIDRVDYRKLQPIESLIYCDPPYNGTTKYSSEFDSEEFWGVVRKWSDMGNVVIVSEYEAPDDFLCIAELSPYKSMQKARTEKLFLCL